MFNGKARAPGVGEYNIDVSSFKLKPTSSNKHGLAQAPKPSSLKLCKFILISILVNALNQKLISRGLIY